MTLILSLGSCIYTRTKTKNKGGEKKLTCLLGRLWSKKHMRLYPKLKCLSVGHDLAKM